MKKNEEKVVEKRELYNQAEVRLEKRNHFSILGYHILSAIIAIMIALQGYFSTSSDSNLRRIFKIVLISVISVLVISLFLAIRFYKKREIIALRKKHITINKALTYTYLIPIVGWIVLIMFTKKIRDNLLDEKGNIVGSVPLAEFNSKLLPYRISFYALGAFIFVISLSLVIYNLVLMIKYNTNISGEELEKEEFEKQEALSNEGELISEEENKEELNDNIQEEKVKNKEEQNENEKDNEPDAIKEENKEENESVNISKETLEEKTLSELKLLAKSLNIKGYSKLNKKELIDHILSGGSN